MISVKCIFCQKYMIFKIVQFSGSRKYETYECYNHNTSQVTYHIKYGNYLVRAKNIDYQLFYTVDGKTILRKKNLRKIKSNSPFYQIIKTFDYVLDIKPENFETKLQTILTFL